MSDEIREKIAKLPTWAREVIKKLEEDAAPNHAELTRLRRELGNERQRYQRLEGRANAMQEILTCAARGGHETAQAYVDRVVAEFAHEESD